MVSQHRMSLRQQTRRRLRVVASRCLFFSAGIASAQLPLRRRCALRKHSQEWPWVPAAALCTSRVGGAALATPGDCIPSASADGCPLCAATGVRTRTGVGGSDSEMSGCGKVHEPDGAKAEAAATSAMATSWRSIPSGVLLLW